MWTLLGHAALAVGDRDAIVRAREAFSITPTPIVISDDHTAQEQLQTLQG